MSKDKINILDVIPVIYEDVIMKEEKEGEITLSFPSLRNSGLLGFLGRWSKRKYIELDRTGTEVIRQIDGKRRMEDIIRALSGYFEHKDDYAARIIMFISGLKSQGAIKYIISDKKKSMT